MSSADAATPVHGAPVVGAGPPAAGTTAIRPRRSVDGEMLVGSHRSSWCVDLRRHLWRPEASVGVEWTFRSKRDELSLSGCAGTVGAAFVFSSSLAASKEVNGLKSRSAVTAPLDVDPHSALL